MLPKLVDLYVCRVDGHGTLGPVSSLLGRRIAANACRYTLIFMTQTLCRSENHF